MNTKRFTTLAKDCFLLGGYCDDVERIEVTDDYARYQLYKNDELIDELDCDGFVSIVSKAQLKDKIEELINDGVSLYEIIKSHNIVQVKANTQINVGVINDETGETFNNFEFDDFIEGQVMDNNGDYDSYYQIFLQLNDDFSIIKDIHQLNDLLDTEFEDDDEKINRHINSFDDFNKTNQIPPVGSRKFKDSYYNGLSKSDLDAEINNALDIKDFEKLDY